MTTEPQATPEEEAYRRFLDGTWEELSEAARTVFREAELAAHAQFLVRSYCFQPEEFEEAMKKMGRAAAELPERECRLLAKLWRAALSAAASIDADDYETLVGHKVYRGDLHHYYRMLSGMVEKTLQERKYAELRMKRAEREPEDPWEIPF